MNYSLSNLKRKKKSELLLICSKIGLSFENPLKEKNATIAMAIVEKQNQVAEPVEEAIVEEKTPAINIPKDIVEKNIKEDLAEIQNLMPKTVRKLTVHASRDDSVDKEAVAAKKAAKEAKAKAKKEKSKKVAAKKAAKTQFIKMVMDCLLTDLAKYEYNEEAKFWLIPASEFGPDKTYKVVKTYGASRSAWLGSGHRTKDGTWKGHRHPAPRYLLEKGYESALVKNNGKWALRVQKCEDFISTYKK